MLTPASRNGKDSLGHPVVSGTFAIGPFQGIAPTGRRAEIRGVDVMEIADGLIQHNTIYYDGPLRPPDRPAARRG
jgi:hypothetical protein